MDPWVWAILLLLIGMTLIMLDIFVPTGGVLAFLAVCSILGAIGLGFSAGSAIGVGILAGAVFGTIAVVAMALKYWPSTAIGKRMLLQVPTAHDVLPESSLRRTLEPLIGRMGRATSEMLPSGIVAVDGASFDAVSEGPPIEAGQRVQVIEVRANRLVVRGLADPKPDAPPQQDPLAQPVDWDSSDPFRPSAA